MCFCISLINELSGLYSNLSFVTLFSNFFKVFKGKPPLKKLPNKAAPTLAHSSIKIVLDKLFFLSSSSILKSLKPFFLNFLYSLNSLFLNYKCNLYNYSYF